MRFFKRISAVLIAAVLIVAAVTSASAAENETPLLDVDAGGERIVGDADGDGTVSVMDATAIQRRLADFSVESFVLPSADTDRNGEIDIVDATGIQRWLADLNTNCEVGTAFADGLFLAEWLNDMMLALGMEEDDSLSLGYKRAIDRAAVHGLLPDGGAQIYEPLIRENLAGTVVRALGYEQRTVYPVFDVNEGDDLMTLAYYGYFTTDDADMLYPAQPVDTSEYERLLEEMRRYTAFNGKRILSFGDSIMRGIGNGNIGISKLIAEKYGMTAVDRAVSRATFGVYDTSVSHIPDEIRNSVERGDAADFILINGGTNDMVKSRVPIGSISGSFELNDFDETTFAGGMEASMYLLGHSFEGVPVIYVRAHNMNNRTNDATEALYGDMGAAVAQKWSVGCADIFNETGFNTDDPVMCEKYTWHPTKQIHDSIHPTALGYAKYYLPLICDRMADSLPAQG